MVSGTHHVRAKTERFCTSSLLNALGAWSKHAHFHHPSRCGGWCCSRRADILLGTTFRCCPALIPPEHARRGYQPSAHDMHHTAAAASRVTRATRQTPSAIVSPRTPCARRGKDALAWLSGSICAPPPTHSLLDVRRSLGVGEVPVRVTSAHAARGASTLTEPVICMCSPPTP